MGPGKDIKTQYTASSPNPVNEHIFGSKSLHSTSSRNFMDLSKPKHDKGQWIFAKDQADGSFMQDPNQ